VAGGVADTLEDLGPPPLPLLALLLHALLALVFLGDRFWRFGTLNT